ncbi:endonuclease/exonuclease/phosphatase family protein [Tropicimonas sp. IMCC34043]|uniref:endonuclease/exonuclease/phosphatase family protein n=1 Tax=Tropicimonas sp. IMCC34043 TaxID=2248760 RepID=UPI001300A6BC|nr:endonuclease/exonuclease/phosphatase family protein [Tropicimonas sp. IMCC34043]
MREIVTETVARMAAPASEERGMAAVALGNLVAHDRFVAEWTCFNTIELVGPDRPAAPGNEIVVAAWNMGRCKRVEAAADLIRASGADVVLASELDHGMARSGQRHTAHDLAEQLGFGYAFGVEFVELGLGDAAEARACVGMSNRHGLHGNAILSRWPLEDAALIPLDSGGGWFGSAAARNGPHRIGGRMALAARILTAAGPLTLVSTHFEVRGDPRVRAAQAETLLAGLLNAYPSGPTVIGGDLNTRALLQGGTTAAEALARPERIEHAFGRFAAQGFGWKTSNCFQGTARVPDPSGPDAPLLPLDWILVRKAVASAPFMVPALAPGGDILSDHALVGARIHVSA